MATSFDDILNAADLPPPGPQHFLARRSLWLTPRATSKPTIKSTSKQRQRLEDLLRSKNAAQSDYAWQNGVKTVWDAFNQGGTLNTRLPLPLVIKIIYAAWLRNDTWPVGAVVPESDDAPDNMASSEALPPMCSPRSSGATTPWLTADNVGDIEPEVNVATNI
ncbi:hypothetical protein H0H92_010987 [Tricholoma furcatifolium]|nr:hypothetical protein H0H92_010987 [Tricholoma furcatifolium]